jgi:hypothetical protein
MVKKRTQLSITFTIFHPDSAQRPLNTIKWSLLVVGRILGRQEFAVALEIQSVNCKGAE